MTNGPFPPPSTNTVTASELVRHFGEWQRRAANAPVYILHHRRPQFVLASVEFMQALTARAGGGAKDAVANLIDALPDPVVIVDRAGIVVAAGRAARLCFGEGVAPGALFGGALAPDSAARIVAAIRRVCAGRIAEWLALREPGLTIDLMIAPYPAGALLCARTAGIAEARDRALARLAAMSAALCARAGTAMALIDHAGRLTEPDAALSRLTHLSIEQLAHAPLVDLFAAADRAPVAAMLSATISGGPPATMEVRIVAGRHAPTAASLSVASVAGDPNAAALTAVLVERG